MTPPAGIARTFGAVLACLTATAALATLLVTPARADTPQARATALATEVAALRHQAEVASEQYDAAQSKLAVVVTEASLSEQAAQVARATDVRAAGIADERARELYMVGGPGPLYVQVLVHGSDLTLLQTGLMATRNVVARTKSTAALAAAQNDAARVAAAHANALADQQTRLEAQVAAKTSEIRATLAATQHALDDANAQVRELAAQVAAQRAAADTARFAAMLQTALVTHGGDVVGSPGAPSVLAARALAAALALQGKPYQWGGNGPDSYDCSGMTKASYAAAGFALPRTAAEQYNTGPHPSLAQLLPGDLLFWASNPADPATIDHVAIYAGHGQMVSANHTGDVVRLQPVWWSGYAGATRPGASTLAGSGAAQQSATQQS